MKIISLIFAWFLICLNGFAQDKGTISLSTGIAFPTGNFKSKDLQNPQAGMARTGWFADVNAAWTLKNWIGVKATLRYAEFRFNNDAYDNVFWRDASRYTQSTPYQNYSFLVGPEIGHKISSRISLGFFSQVGFQKVICPDLRSLLVGYGRGGDDKGMVFVDQSNELGFCYVLGLSANYHISDRFRIKLQCDYQHTKIRVQQDQYSDSPNSRHFYETINYPIGSVSAGLGLVWVVCIEK